ncbi:MAG TPA: ribonuclease H-like domain-containing protein [Candidatus Limnocylindria bacterium]|nr:ribonuclease H-like domain-containing protein [Candidatus Limnocylindria bacterium]
MALGTTELLARRLDRLRAGGRPTQTTGPITRPDHARALADSVGGRVDRTSRGAVVWVETESEVAVDRGGLGALPYSVGADQPFVCLDLETTGLATAAGTVAFLVGLGFWDGSRMSVRQLLLPDHADEDAFLDALVDALPADPWLVTYNGRTFDWPLLTARFRLHRRAAPAYAGHLDLLPVARQLWKHRTGNARLATIEDAVCAVVRDGDLPGALIPERYFGYLRSRRGELLRDVVEHNRQDIVSLGLLLAVLGNYAEGSNWARLHPGDLAGLARGFVRRGRTEDALQCVEAALGADAWSLGVIDGASVRRHLSAERARLLARLGRRPEAHAAWLEIALRGGPGAALAWLHVARHREHRERDVAGALAACHEAAAVAERARLWDRPMLAIEADLERRMARLRRKSFARRVLRSAA